MSDSENTLNDVQVQEEELKQAKQERLKRLDSDVGGDDVPLTLPSDKPDHSGKLPSDVMNNWLKNIEEYVRLWNDSKYWSIQVPYIVDLGLDEPFFGALSRRVLKTRSTEIPTAGVCITENTIEMLWNPVFFKHELEKVSKKYPLGVIKHEFYHIIFEHMTSRRQTPHVLWNAATDLAINSLIPEDELPGYCLFPGKMYVPPNPPPGWKPSMIANIIRTLPREKSAEYYMSKFLSDPDVQDALDDAKTEVGSSEGPEFENKLRQKLYGENGGGQFDDHAGWDKLTDDQRDMMRDHVRDLLRNCVKEMQNKGWGSVSSFAQSYLKKVLSTEVDWRELMNNFIGKTRSTYTTSSIKRINRRVPWEFPGRKRMYTAKPAIAIDQSGSMTDWWIELLFAEVSNLGSVTEYDIIPFDYAVDEKNIQTVRRGQEPKTIRTLGGGTSFDAPVKYVNENAKRYDCLFILTDGGCSSPIKCEVPLMYILAPGCELAFNPGDIPVIKMTDTRKK